MKSSTKAKDRYNKKNYDEIKIRVKKGKKEKIKECADKLNLSMNEYIVSLIDTSDL